MKREQDEASSSTTAHYRKKAKVEAEDDHEEEEEEDLEFDTFGGKKSRQGAVKSIDEEDEDEDDDGDGDKEPKVPLKRFDHRREYEEPKMAEEEGIEAFNLDAEMEEGHFDEAGNYIRKKDENRDKDNWLQGFSESDIQKAREAQIKRLEREKRAITDSKNSEHLTLPQLYRKLLQFLEPGQSATSALKLAKHKMTHGENGGPVEVVKKGVPKRKPRKNAPANAAVAVVDPTLVAELKRDIEGITDLCSSIVQKGIVSIYEMSYESIYEEIKKA